MKISKNLKKSLTKHLKNYPYFSGTLTPICKWYYMDIFIYFVFCQIGDNYIVYDCTLYTVGIWDCKSLGILTQIPDEIIDQIKAESL